MVFVNGCFNFEKLAGLEFIEICEFNISLVIPLICEWEFAGFF